MVYNSCSPVYVLTSGSDFHFLSFSIFSSLQCLEYKERASVLENKPAGTFVLQVHAEDADEGANGKVTYGFMHKDSTVPAFSIDPETGTTIITHVHCIESMKVDVPIAQNFIRSLLDLEQVDLPQNNFW